MSKPPSPPKTADEFGKPAAPPSPEEVTKVTSNVLEFAKTSRGEAVFILENGGRDQTLHNDGTIYEVSENGGGDSNHPQVWVYKPSTATNLAPTGVVWSTFL